MRTFVDITFAADGPSVVETARRLKEFAGLEVIVGEHDLVFDWTSSPEFDARMDRIQKALRGTGATFRTHSMLADGDYVPPIEWAAPPSLTEMPLQNHTRSASVHAASRTDHNSS